MDARGVENTAVAATSILRKWVESTGDIQRLKDISANLRSLRFIPDLHEFPPFPRRFVDFRRRRM
jgi:hypothetical protein